MFGYVIGERIWRIRLDVFFLAAVLQASGFDIVALDPFSYGQNRLNVYEVDIG